MDVQTVSSLKGRSLTEWKKLLEESGLSFEGEPDSTVLCWDGEQLIATGSRKKNLLKYLAVSKDRQGEDLTATVLTYLRKDAFCSGYTHLFLYTKPKNRLQFGSLFFYPIAETKDVLLLESERGGIKNFLRSLPVMGGNKVGAAVMNCNPFTLGHRHLIAESAKQCDRFYVFVLSEENPPFTAEERLKMVKDGTADLKNVTVYPAGYYLISSATFPTYFLKDRDSADTVKCELDIQIFTKYYAPHFGITDRFVADEPFSAATEKYNEQLKKNLPQSGINFNCIKRLKIGDRAVSATEVRRLIEEKNTEEIKELVPKTTFDFLMDKNYI